MVSTIMLCMGCAKSGKLGNHAFKSPETPKDVWYGPNLAIVPSSMASFAPIRTYRNVK